MKTKITQQDLLMAKTDHPILEILKDRGFPILGTTLLDLNRADFEWRLFREIQSGEITVVCKDLRKELKNG